MALGEYEELDCRSLKSVETPEDLIKNIKSIQNCDKLDLKAKKESFLQAIMSHYKNLMCNFIHSIQFHKEKSHEILAILDANVEHIRDYYQTNIVNILNTHRSFAIFEENTFSYIKYIDIDKHITNFIRRCKLLQKMMKYQRHTTLLITDTKQMN